jgi:mannose-6-phosphate isomerase-like protein (cupin superfamily)
METTRVEKPWGYYEDIHRSKVIVFKKIVVKPNQKLSYQYHDKRSEVWYIEKGWAKVTIDDSIFKMTDGNKIDIPIKHLHRLENLSPNLDLVVFEVQFGECDENDIIRIEDDYGRET